MKLAIKTNSIEKNIYILECLTHQYLGLGNNYLQKNIHIFSSIWNLFFKLPKIKGPMQVLTNALEKHNYINLSFEMFLFTCLRKMEWKNYWII
jgi:hypothetical protein